MHLNNTVYKYSSNRCIVMSSLYAMWLVEDVVDLLCNADILVHSSIQKMMLCQTMLFYLVMVLMES